MLKEKAKTHSMTIRFSERERRILEEEAKRDGRSMAGFIRWLVEDYHQKRKHHEFLREQNNL